MTPLKKRGREGWRERRPGVVSVIEERQSGRVAAIVRSERNSEPGRWKRVFLYIYIYIKREEAEKEEMCAALC